MMRGGGGGMTSPGGSYSSGTMGPGVGSMFGRSGSSTLGSASGGTFKDLWRGLSFLGNHKRAVITSYVAWVVAIVLELQIPIQIRRAIDEGIGTMDSAGKGNGD